MQRQRNKRHPNWLRWVFITALLICLSLVGFQKYQQMQLSRSIAQARTVKVRPVKKTIKAPQKTYWDRDTSGQTVGRLVIPAVGIKLPIIKGIGQTNGEDNMLKAAVTNKQGQAMGQRNYVLSSHEIAQANLLFSPLDQTQIGDRIYITDMQKVYTYQTISHRTVTADQVSILDDVPNKRLITLYTCDPNGRLVDGQTYERVVVVGRLIKTTTATASNLARFN